MPVQIVAVPKLSYSRTRPFRRVASSRATSRPSPSTARSRLAGRRSASSTWRTARPPGRPAAGRSGRAAASMPGSLRTRSRRSARSITAGPARRPGACAPWPRVPNRCRSGRSRRTAPRRRRPPPRPPPDGRACRLADAITGTSTAFFAGLTLVERPKSWESRHQLLIATGLMRKPGCVWRSQRPRIRERIPDRSFFHWVFQCQMAH